MDLVRGGALVVATVATGLLAGLFYGFSIAVMPALAASDDRTYVGAMQSINRVIQNGWLALVSLAALGPGVVALVGHLGADDHRAVPWIIVGLALYVATWIVTFAVNIPLNNALDAAGDPDQITDLAAVRARFQSSWVPWNHVRSVLNTGALAALGWALVEYGRMS
jgi:uncharacterized membrane protein